MQIQNKHIGGVLGAGIKTSIASMWIHASDS